MVKNRTWAHPNADQEKIIVLTGEVVKIHHAMKKPAEKKDKKADNNRNNNTNNNQGQQNWTPHPICEEDRWHYVLPDKDAPHTKNKDNKKYYWCPNHANACGLFMHQTIATTRRAKMEGRRRKRPQRPLSSSPRSILMPQMQHSTKTVTKNDATGHWPLAALHSG